MKAYFKQISTPILFLLSLFISFSCSDSLINNEKNRLPDNEYKVTITQGVWGNVWFWEGDFMPSTDNSSDGKITAVQRDVYIHEATMHNMVERSSGSTFFAKINSEFITTVRSDKDGFFQAELAPGKYSFFVKEDSLFYANEGDGEGYIQTASVDSNKITKRQIDISYKSTW